MSTLGEGRNDQRREAIRQTLVLGAGAGPEAGAVAAAVLGVWHRIGECLVPMIGARGVEALFGRALQLTASAFPWLAAAGEDKTSLAGVASVALLATFTELLATLIGASLTDRLLDPVWTVSTPPAGQETRP
jgi:hypothetical protein